MALPNGICVEHAKAQATDMPSRKSRPKFKESRRYRSDSAHRGEAPRQPIGKNFPLDGLFISAREMQGILLT